MQRGCSASYRKNRDASRSHALRGNAARTLRVLLGNTETLLVPTLCVGMQRGRSAFSVKEQTTVGRSRYKIVEEKKPHFLTCTVVKWLPLFGKPHIAEIVIDSLKFMQKNERIKIYAYVIMEYHIHLIASSENMGNETAKFKSFTARKIIRPLSKVKFYPIKSSEQLRLLKEVY